MSEKTKAGLYIVASATLLGILGDALLRSLPWGLNLFLWTGALAACSYAISRMEGARALPREARAMFALALLFASLFVWRSSIALRFLDAWAILAALSFATFSARGVRLGLAGVFKYAHSAVSALGGAMFGALPLVFSDVKWREIPREGWSKHALAAARGLLIAAPLVFIFGSLLMAADALYEGVVRNALGIDADLAFSHLFLFAFFAWITGGYLRALFFSAVPLTFARAPHASVNSEAARGKGESDAHGDYAANRDDAARSGDVKHALETGDEAKTSARSAPTQSDVESSVSQREAFATGYKFSAGEDERRITPEEFRRERAKEEAARQEAAKKSHASNESGASFPSMRERFSLGVVEIGIVLGVLNALFISFVAVQLRYFFGDAERVVSSAGLTFSEYARRGFFELVWVALLALPLLLAADWLLRKERAAHARIFRALSGVMIALLFVIMASALWRMRLYQDAYGLTEMRLYTTVFMFWLGLVFVWFALTVLRGRRERFAFGAFAAWLALLFALHAVNPNDLIVRTNLARARGESGAQRFDAAYAASLGADAAPALFEALPELSAGQRGSAAYHIRLWAEWDCAADWRSLNLSRRRACQLVRDNDAALREWEKNWRTINGAAIVEKPASD